MITMKTLYQFKDYREFLKEELDSPRFGRGGRSELAGAIGMELSLLSRILGGRSDFTPEHALKAARFFKFDDTMTRYFLLSIYKSRAGTVDLKEYYQTQLDKIKDAQNKIKAKVQVQSKMTEQDLIHYYGSWHHIFVHMAVRNQNLRKVDAIAKYLKISNESTRKSLAILEKLGLVKEISNEWRVTDAMLHFSNFPTALRENHSNLRQIAIRNFDESRPKDLHYSTVISADADSVDKMRELILNLIKESQPIITKAEDEKVLVFNIDFFQFGGND